jgi:putative ABC transport system permease protein
MHTLKLALRVLSRRKFFTFVSLFAVSFTLLVLLVATALLDHVFGPQGPEDRPDRTLVVLTAELRGEHFRRTGWAGHGLLHRTLPDLPGVERATVFAMPRKLTTYHDGRKITCHTRRTDGEFWRVFRFDFVEGGPFTVEDEAEAAPVAVINESLRDRLFGGGPAVGKAFELDGRRLRVAGVVRNVPFVRLLTFSDAWIPTSLSRSDAYRKELVGDFVGAMILAPGARREDAAAEFARRVAAVPIDEGGFESLDASADTMFGAISGYLFSGLLARRPGAVVSFLWLAALLFMALPALNLVNLNLSRILERASEIGVRKSFGATSGALVRQFLLENVVLAVLGGILAAVLAALVLAALNRSGLVPHARFALNLRVLGWGALLTLVFGVLSGVLPAWRMSRLHPVGALQGRFE